VSSVAQTTFPLSFAQERLWFLDQLSPGDPAYLVSTQVRLPGPVDASLLERCLNAVVARHESLRTRFAEEDGRPVALVLAELHVPLRVVDLRALPQAARESEAGRLAALEARTPFDLEVLPLITATLIMCGDADSVLCVTMHHIVADGWSLGLFFRDLDAYLRAAFTHTPPELPALDIDYPDFAAWQRARLDPSALEAELDWWQQTLAGAPALELPTDHPRRSRTGGEAGVHAFDIPAGVARPVLARGHAEGCTAFMTLLAAFATLLGRYADQEDVVLGTYTAGRERPELESVIGFFVNTVALRCDLSGDPPFPVLLRRVRETVLNALAHESVPFAGVVERVAPARESTRNPLFDVVFHLYNLPGASVDAARAAAAADHRGAAVLDLVCSMWHAGDGFEGQVEYRTELFEPATVAAFARRFQTLLAGLAAGADGPVGAIEILSPEEWRAEVFDENATDTPDASESIVAMFERQANATPDDVAFVFGDRRLTYRELRTRALSLAARLREAGAGPEVVVGLHLSRSLELPIGLLATLYEKAAFLPLDIAYPAHVLIRMVADAGARIVVAAGSGPGGIELPGVTVLDIEAGPAELAEPTSHEVPLSLVGDQCTPDQLAYVIFTSGSTGRPKGVAVEHRQVLNRLAWMWDAYPFASGEVACQKTPAGFVDSLWELLGPLLRGVPCVIIPDAAVGDPALLINELAKHGVTRIWLVPSLLRQLLDAVPDLATRAPRLRFWVLSGEPLPRALAARFHALAPDAALYNLYGTSEVWDATWHDGTHDGADTGQVPIGRPIANVQSYVLDRGLRPVPRGSLGELVIGGHGVARGYVAGDDGRFVADPFRRASHRRLYRTGDLVRRRADGSLELLGRRDQQVQLRGFRLEPAEVEAALLAHPAVRDAVVTVPAGTEILTAYVTGGADAAALRAFAAERLAEHLRPGRIIVLEALPLTPSGKVDRGRLPDPGGAGVDGAGPSRAPETALEQVVAAVWAAVLDRDSISIDDDFFADLGGHSLLGMRVITRLRRLLRIELPVRRLFEASTVAALAKAIALETRPGQAEETAAMILGIAAMGDAEAEAQAASVLKGDPG
jgi:amino acid adenylation domain-containing protein